jgi:membrane-bound lytic murein transglycosylase B
MAKHIRPTAGRTRSSAPSRRRQSVDRAAILTTLAIVSTAWTANLAGMGPASFAGGDDRAALADPVMVPAGAIKPPANYARTRSIGRSVPAGSRAQVVATASTNGIPAAALNAYQRAESVINAADKSCHIPWQLIAAIGRVESDHGRYGGNTLGTDGVSRPGIYGVPLNGRNKTHAIADTDAGLYDDDAVWDRAVGPMQFIPSTWSVVGVDADGDAKRNPQDIDDAALASAVYLCSGTDDLSTEPGQRKSVYRYNHSEKYVDLVLSIMNAYTEGDYTSVPNNITSAVTFTPDFHGTGPVLAGGTKTPAGGGHSGAGTSAGGGADLPAEEPAQQAEQPDDPAPIAQVTKAVTEPVKTVTTMLTLPQAILRCTSLGYSLLFTRVAWNECIAEYTTGH